MEQFVNSYTGGMNKDSSPNRYSNTQYWDAHNIRLVTSDSDGLTSGAVTNFKGTSIALTLPDSAEVLGSVALRDYLILFAKGSTTDYIFRIPKASVATAQNLILTTDYYFDVGADPAVDMVIYKGALGFDTDYPIHAVANYETSTIQKVYWVDGLNPLKHINIVYNADTNDLENLATDILEISPQHTYGLLDLTLGIGGSMKAGRIQYSYQLYTPNGSETMFSPTSGLLNISQYSTTQILDRQSGGSAAETICSKSVEVGITLTDYSNFSRIRLVALEYEDYNLIPQVRVVTEREISSNNITIIDYGASIGDMALEQFQFLQHEITPKTLEVKKNHLFTGNIKESIFDIDELWQETSGSPSAIVDPRAYRSRIAPAGTTTDTATYTTPSPSIQAATFSTVKGGTEAWVIEINNVNLDAISGYLGMTGNFWGDGYVDYLDVVVDWEDFEEPPGEFQDTIRLDLTGITSYSYIGGATDRVRLEGNGYTSGYGPSATWQAGDATHYYVSVALDTPANFYVEYSYEYVSGVATEDVVINKDDPAGYSSEQVLNFTDASVFNRYNAAFKDDCVNVFNNLVNDTSDEYGFQYVPGTALTTPVLGGEGKFVSYNFSTTNVDSFSSTNNGLTMIGGRPGYTDSEDTLSYTGYQRDEVYRFGLIFFDLDGRSSPVKWIADIRFPNIESEAFTSTSNIRSLGIEFDFNWTNFNTLYPNLLDKLSGVQVVRVLRVDKDKSIKAQGILNPVATMIDPDDIYTSPFIIATADEYNTGTTGSYSVMQATEAMLKTTFDLISPQVTYNQDVTIGSNDFLEVIAGATMDYYARLTGVTDLRSVVQVTNDTTYTACDLTDTNRANVREDITYSSIQIPQEKNPTVIAVDGSNNYESRVDYATVGDYSAYRGTAILVSIGTAYLSTAIQHGTDERLFANYRTYLGYSQYGGASYYDRPFNSYVGIGTFESTPPSTAIVEGNQIIYEGDTYLIPYNHMYAMTDVVHETRTSQNLIGFITESSINVVMQTTPMLKYFDDLSTYSSLTDLEDNGYSLQELQSKGISTYPEHYPSEVGDLYKYNSAYSAEDKSKTYSIKPFDFQGENFWDYRIYVSELKFPSEYSDSWLDFKFNNYLDVESNYGALTRLINHKDKMIFFQPTGVGVLSVAERETIQSTNTAQLVLGTGGIMDRYDYLDVKTGTEWHDSIIDTGGYLMYYDNILKQIRSVTGATEPTSEVKGLKSYYDGVTIDNLITTYDFENREILFSPTGLYTAEPTTVFSGFLNVFTSFYDLNDTVTTVKRFMPLDELLLSSADLNKIYLHNVGAYGVFYNATPKTSSIELIINPLQQQPISLHKLSWLSNIYDTSDVTYETVDWLQITNSYQDTGALDATTEAVAKRVLRKWRANELRNSADNGRLRDSYMKAKFSYDNNDGFKMTLHDIISDYLPTKLR